MGVAQRGLTNKQRGYGRAHERLRRELAPAVASGSVRCASCGELIAPGVPWDLGHDENDRSLYAGPEHASCNRRTVWRRDRRLSRKW